MKNIKYIIILLLVILLIIASVIFILMKDVKVEEEELGGKGTEEEIELDIEEDNDINTYIYLSQLVTNFFNYMYQDESDYMDNGEGMVKLLNQEYVDENNLNNENVKEFFSNKYRNFNSYVVKEIYKKESILGQDTRGIIYHIKGIIRYDGEEQEVYVMVKEDYSNEAYSISFIDKQEYKEFENVIDVNIKQNDYNATYVPAITDYQICLAYFKDYINTVKNNPKIAYKLLEEEYRNKRFGSIDNYTNYINSIKEEISIVVLRKYQIENKENSTQYICIDQKGNYYIFEAKEPMNYTLVLDTYTIDSTEFIEKYNNASEKNKTYLNIQRICEALTAKDYEYVYNKIENTFKNNNFSNINNFKAYIETKFYNISEIEYLNVSTEGNVYIYNIKVIDLENKNNSNNLTILIRLLDGTDFEISFALQ